MTPTVSVLTGFDYATLAFQPSFYLWSSNAFQNRLSCEDIRRAENSEDFWGFGVRSSPQFCPCFCSQPITKPGFYLVAFFIVLTQAFSRLTESVIDKKNI